MTYNAITLGYLFLVLYFRLGTCFPVNLSLCQLQAGWSALQCGLPHGDEAERAVLWPLHLC